MPKFDHENNERFIFVMGALAEAAQQTLNDFKIKVYAQGLEDIPIETIETAAWNLVRTRTLATWPKIGEIREAAIGKVEDEAILALTKMERACFIHGAYATVVFDDPIIHAIVRSFGGWPKICVMEPDEWKFKRIEFQKVYRAYAPNLHRVEIPITLVGIDERDNSTRQDALPVRIAYVGNRKAIEAWQAKFKTVDQIEGRSAVAGLIDHVLS